MAFRPKKAYFQNSETGTLPNKAKIGCLLIGPATYVIRFIVNYS